MCCTTNRYSSIQERPDDCSNEQPLWQHQTQTPHSRWLFCPVVSVLVTAMLQAVVVSAPARCLGTELSWWGCCQQHAAANTHTHMHTPNQQPSGALRQEDHTQLGVLKDTRHGGCVRKARCMHVSGHLTRWPSRHNMLGNQTAHHLTHKAVQQYERVRGDQRGTHSAASSS